MRVTEVIEGEPRMSERGGTVVLEMPEEIPWYRVVTVRGPSGEALEAYRGVQREDTGHIVSVVSDRYGLVQHRTIAEAVHRIGEALERPERIPDGPHPFRREQIRLYANGRRMEMKLVIGQRFRLDGENEFYPALRVLNSLDGAWAVRMEAFAVRIACTNQLFAGARSYMEFRELHLSSAGDLLAQLEKATYEVLEHFDESLRLYGESMHQTLPLREVVPALSAAGLPNRHVERIAERLPTYFGSLLWGEVSRWDAYQLATDYLSHEVQVNPERERLFERATARALLLENSGEGEQLATA